MTAGFERPGLLPAPEIRRGFPMARGVGITVGIREHEDEILAAADLPGVEKADISGRGAGDSIGLHGETG